VADTQDKTVSISITGPASARRRLLAVIRSDFERIHHDFPNLKPNEMVALPAYPDTLVPYQKLLAMERAQITRFPEVVKGKVIDVNPLELLNGVDLERTLGKESATKARRPPLRVFFSYAHADEVLRNELETHLKILQRLGRIEPWHDRMIEAGDEWKLKIDENLEGAHIILLLISVDFVASEYCWEKEMKRALERHDKKEACVVPIIVRHVDWKKGPFAKLQALPTDGVPVTDRKWGRRDAAWSNVSEGIERVIEHFWSSRREAFR
jgi:internalin A